MDLSKIQTAEDCLLYVNEQEKPQAAFRELLVKLYDEGYRELLIEVLNLSERTQDYQVEIINTAPCVYQRTVRCVGPPDICCKALYNRWVARVAIGDYTPMKSSPALYKVNIKPL